MPAVSYIVSAYNRPRFLRGCLASLQVQTDPDFEVIVADNGDDLMQNAHRTVVSDLSDARFRHVNTVQRATNTAWDSYWAAEWIVANEAKGEWICLPSDDSYYMPVFQATLLDRARVNNWQLVWPEMLYDRRIHGKYAELNARPHVGGIDKTGFLIRRDIWIGFPTKNIDGKPRGSDSDGHMIMQVVAQGALYGKVEEVLCIHN